MSGSAVRRLRQGRSGRAATDDDEVVAGRGHGRDASSVGWPDRPQSARSDECASRALRKRTIASLQGQWQQPGKRRTNVGAEALLSQLEMDPGRSFERRGDGRMSARVINLARALFFAATLVLPLVYFAVVDPKFEQPNTFEDGQGYLTSGQRLLSTGTPYQDYQLAGPYGGETTSDTYRYPPPFAQIAALSVETDGLSAHWCDRADQFSGRARPGPVQEPGGPGALAWVRVPPGLVRGLGGSGIRTSRHRRRVRPVRDPHCHPGWGNPQDHPDRCPAGRPGADAADSPGLRRGRSPVPRGIGHRVADRLDTVPDCGRERIPGQWRL